MTDHRHPITCRAWWAAFLFLALSPLTTSDIFAAGTPAGTVITNVATADYQDINGNQLPKVTSNQVDTTVLPVAGVDVSPETSTENILAGGSVNYAIQVTNTGNVPDVLTLSVSNVPAGWTTTVYKDLNGNGVLEPLEQDVSNIIDVVAVLADETAPVILKVQAPANAVNGAIANIGVTATSEVTPTVTDTGTYTAVISTAVLTVNKIATPTNPKPGNVVTYALRGENSGATTAFNVVITDPLPSGVTYVPGSIRFGQGANITYDNATTITDAQDADPGNFGISGANTMTFAWGDSPGGQTGAVFFQVVVNEGQASGKTITNVATITYENSPGTPATPFNSSGGTFTVAAKANPSVTASTNAGSKNPGSKQTYALTVTNNGNANDVFNVTTTSTGGFPNAIWVDTNGDGIAGNGGDFLLTDTDGDGSPDTGNLTSGEIKKLLIEVTVPVGSTDGTQDVTTVKVTSKTDPTVSKSLTLTTTAIAPAIAATKSVSPTGTQLPGQVLTYTMTLTNNGQGNATSVVLTDIVPTNTTYVPNSVLVDGAARTDASDGDNTSVSNRNIVVNLATFGPSAQKTVTFRATINAATPASTIIRNKATVNSHDSNGNSRPVVTTNEVTTTIGQQAQVDLSPESGTDNVIAGGSSYFPFRVTNTGNAPDTYTLATSNVSAGWSAVIYADLNENGSLEQNEVSPSNVVSNTSSLSPAQKKWLLLFVTAPSDATNNSESAITVTATSQTNTSQTDTGTYTTTVSDALVEVNKVASPSNPRPNDVVTYSMAGTNNGNNDAFNVVITDTIPNGLTYVANSLRISTDPNATYATAQPLTDAQDADPGDFSISAQNAITAKFGDIPVGQGGALFFQARVNNDQAAGTIITNIAYLSYETVPGVPAQPFKSHPSLLTVSASSAPQITTSSPTHSGESGDAVSYPFTVTNGGNGNETLNLSTTSTGGFPNKIWVDANGDGIAGNDGDYLLTDTDGDGKPDTGSLAPGESASIIMVVSIPPGTEDGTTDVTTLTVTPSGNPGAAINQDFTTTVKSPVIQVNKSVSPTGPQPPGQTLTYTAVVKNTGTGIAINAVFNDPIPANTKYVVNTVTIDGIPKTDISDADKVRVSNGNIVVNLGTMGPNATHTITFKVTIN